MANREGRNGLLEAGYDGLRLELQETEDDIRKLLARAEKLQAAVAALKDLVSERCPPTNGAADGDVWVKHGPPV